MADRTLRVEIVGDASSLQRTFGKAADSGDRLGNTFKSLGRAAAYGGAAVGGAVVIGAFKAVNAASDLNESLNAVNVTFGKSAKIVTDFGKNAAQRTGLSMRELNQSVVPIGASLQNMGASANEAAKTSVNLAKRAADMASVFNTDVGSALTAIQAGLRGEADPLERFGVGLSAARVEAYALSTGLIKTKSELTDQIKVQARVGLLMKDSAKFAGDFANTSDGLANSQRILRAEVENAGAAIGTALLPVAAKVVGVLADMVPKAVEVGSAIAGKVGPALTTFIDTIKQVIPVLIGIFQPLVEEIGSRLVPIFQTLQEIGGRAITAIGEVIRANGPQLRQIFENLGTVISNLAKIILPILEIAFTKILPAALRVLIPALVITTTAMAKLSEVARVVSQVITAVLRPVIAAVVPVVTAMANAFTTAWNKVSAVVKAAIGAITPLINGIKQLIMGMVNVVVGIITGDWARAWSGLKQAAMGGWNIFKAWLLGLPATVAGWARQVGEAIIRGIGEGMSGLVGWLLGQAGSVVSQVKDKLEFWHSPPEAYGKDIGERLIGKKGMAGGIAEKASEAAQAAADAVKAAQDAVEAAAGDFASAFGTLAGDALSAFDAVVSAWQPKAQIRLDKLHAKEQLAQLKADLKSATTDISAAQVELQKALAGGDPEQVKSAQQAVTDAMAQQLAARRALRDYNLEQEAQAQQAAHEKQAARERLQFENQLAALQRAYGNQEITTRQFHQRLNKLMSQHGVDQEFYGTAAGIMFASGIQKSTNAVVAAFTKLLKRVERLMKLHSNAAEGPLSDLDTWWSAFIPTLAKGVNLDDAKKVGAGIAGAVGSGLGSVDGSGILNFNDILKLRGTVGTAATDITESFTDIAKSKDALGDNIQEFSDSAQGNFNKLSESTQRIKDAARVTFPDVAKTLTKGAVDSANPLAFLAYMLDNVTASMKALRFSAYELRDGLRDTIGEIGVLIGGAGGGKKLANLNLLTGRAGGGPVAAGRTYLVGESGPEVFIPRTSGYISSGAGGGGGTEVTLNFYGTTIGTSREFEDVVRLALYNVQRRNPGTGLTSA